MHGHIKNIDNLDLNIRVFSTGGNFVEPRASILPARSPTGEIAVTGTGTSIIQTMDSRVSLCLLTCTNGEKNSVIVQHAYPVVEIKPAAGAQVTDIYGYKFVKLVEN
ncbi:hypothetical protein Lal_00000519 [Lupinus albus]|nr:hypothetical protein Lal_00000519 [Lupinus albus]